MEKRKLVKGWAGVEFGFDGEAFGVLWPREIGSLARGLEIDFLFYISI